MHLHHDAMAATEIVQHIGDLEVDRFHLARCHRLGLFHAVAELAAQGLAAHQLLVACLADFRWRDIFRAITATGCGGILFPLRRVDIDQFHHPVAIAAGGRDEQARRNRSGDSHVFFQ